MVFFFYIAIVKFGTNRNSRNHWDRGEGYMFASLCLLREGVKNLDFQGDHVPYQWGGGVTPLTLICLKSP